LQENINVEGSLSINIIGFLTVIFMISMYVALLLIGLWELMCYVEELKANQSLPFKLEHVELDMTIFTCEKLLEQEDQGPAIIQLAMSSSSKAKKQFCDLNSLLEALPHNGPRQTIIFIKEEVVQEGS
nr:F-box domain, leucine-rich repeat domain, L domain-like protein [Tanacetum cinerariifolium]